MTITEGALVLADGSVFEGELIGAGGEDPAVPTAAGEVVFNTVMSGYQEVISDPSYAGQIITFTSAHIGNYGTTPADDESAAPRCSGVVVRELSRRRSSWRADDDLDHYLSTAGIRGIGGVDTRRLTRIIRESGAMGGVIGSEPIDRLVEAARGAPRTDGRDLVATVTCSSPYRVEGTGPATIVAVDCGIKTTIVRCLAELGDVVVVPASTPVDEIMSLAPDGVFLSNGPGDPAAVAHVADTVGSLLGRVPIFGICMGHQLLATALGAPTYKLPFGHHGGNHPVRDLRTGRVEITSQNHNYCVDIEGIDGIEVTHVNLNDHTLEGFVHPGLRAIGIQYHPEAGPGPHDSRYLFQRFSELMGY